MTIKAVESTTAININKQHGGNNVQLKLKQKKEKTSGFEKILHEEMQKTTK